MPLGSLWLPVVCSAVAVWLVSSIVHMVLKYHKADYKALPEEDGVAAALRKSGAGPGHYVLPHCSDFKQFKDPAFLKRFEDGPVGFVTLRPPGPPSMGKPLFLWFLYCLLVSFVVAYLARHTLSSATPGLEVMRITGAGAFLAYGVGALPSSIWGGIPWSNTMRSLVDAVLYAATTGCVFRYLWPAG